MLIVAVVGLIEKTVWAMVHYASGLFDCCTQVHTVCMRAFSSSYISIATWRQQDWYVIFDTSVHILKAMLSYVFAIQSR